MVDFKRISERVAGLRQEIRDLQGMDSQYWVMNQHTQIDESAHEVRQLRLLQIRDELSSMLKKGGDL